MFERVEEAKDAIRVMDQAKFNDRVVLVKEDLLVTEADSLGSERDHGHGQGHHRTAGDYQR